MKTGAFTIALAATLLTSASGPQLSALPDNPQASPPACIGVVEGITWVHWTASRQEMLERWCASVGPAVLRTSTVAPADIKRLVVVTWNVHVGGGQVEDFVKTHWVDRDHTGLVLLLEEAYRLDDSVPDSLPKGLRIPDLIRPKPRSLDVIRLAETLNMSATYVPSMRNGGALKTGEREDRGNAILSTEPITDVRAITLPFGKQRRVAVAATITPRGSTMRSMRVIATHFDVGGSRVAQGEAFADRIAQLSDLPLIVGGDFNSPGGLRDKAVQAVAKRIPMESCGTGRTFTWPQKFNLTAFLAFGRFDFMFSNLGASGFVRQCETVNDWFGSDHRPVMMTISPS
jgi:endonuclease/exonuclease/phosphatase family metal-dependent hydrolase